MHVTECNKAGCGFQELLVRGGAASSPLLGAGADAPQHGTPTALPGGCCAGGTHGADVSTRLGSH